MKFIIIFSLFFLNIFFHSYAHQCNFALIDWQKAYHCIPKEAINHIRFVSEGHLMPIKKILKKLVPEKCLRRLPEEHRYSPFLALSTHGFNGITIRNLNEITPKLNRAMIINDCSKINILSIIGQGRPGNISVGAGAKFNYYKEISLDNKNIWLPKLKLLSGRINRIDLIGSRVGRGEVGIDFVNDLSRVFRCKVVAPTMDIKPDLGFRFISRRFRTESVDSYN